jgi:hypothetical protein
MIARDFEEVDEKLPYLARILINRGIDFRQLESENPDVDTMRSILSILRENLECFSVMTADEIDATLNLVNMSCEVMCLVNEGLCAESKSSPGKYVLTSAGKKYYDNMLQEDPEEDIDSSGC